MSIVVRWRTLLCAGLLVRVGLAAPDAPEVGSFPFVIPVRDASPTVVDVSALNPAPLDATRRIGARDGHFWDATGRRVRFLGVSVAASGCFPRKEDAELIAARMHKYGINCVRLHHMDSDWSVPGLFYFNARATGKPTLTLNAESLDRLDYLIHQFKQHGIYVDLNLHVSRAWTKENGFPDSDSLPRLGKVVAYFEPRAVALQQQFAQDLLGHYNPYTQAKYADEPAIAVLELNNEDSLVGSATTLPTLPPHYRDLISAGWNAWLKRRYGTTAAMLARWNTGASAPEPLGETLLRNGDLRDGLTGWRKETQGTARYNLTAEPAGDLPGAPSGGVLHVGGLQRDGTGWHMQLHQLGLTLEAGKRYTVSLLARAERPRALIMNARLDVNPWTNLGLDTSFNLTTQWKRYTVSFVATVPEPDHCRLSFQLADADADVYLGDLSLRRGGGAVSLPAEETLEAANLSLPAIADNPLGRDYVSYLMQVEADYVAALRRTLAASGSRALVTCSQSTYGGLAGQWREAQTDWVDSHAYWQHPNFPGRPWDPSNWRIGNTPMVKALDGGNLLHLARQRVAGKPFTVSEYDHPAPSEFAAEGVPLIFSFAAWQDWDGVFLFDYTYDSPLADRDRIAGYFDYVQHPGKLGFFPAAARLFLAGEGTATGQSLTANVPTSLVPALTARRASPWDQVGARRPSVEEFLGRRLLTSFGGETLALEPGPPAGPNAAGLVWDRAAGVYSYMSPASRVLVGLLGGRGPVDAFGLRATVAPSKRNFAALTLVSLDGRSVKESGSLLLTAVDKAENPGVQWTPERTFATSAFRAGPVRVTGVTAQLSLPTTARSVSVWALDATGRRAGAVPAELVDGQLSVHIGPEYRTIWYELELRR